MKNAKVITLALLVTAGGLAGAAAQGAGPHYNVGAMDYPLQEWLTNSQRFAYTAGLPALTAGLPTLTNADLETLSGGVFTDGSGHIAGLVYARVYFDGPTNHTNNYGAFTITVSGNTSNRGTNPLVKFTMRGNGYTFDGVTNHPNASLSLTFTSTNKLVDVPSTQVTINSTTYAVTYADGTTQMFANGPATQTNPAYSYLSGTIRGNIQRGQKGGNQLTINKTAALFTAGSIWTVVNGTNFVEQVLNGGLVLDVLTNIDAQVIQPVPGSRLYLNAYVGSSSNLFFATGTASTNSLRWSASFSGVAFAHGSTLQANGDLGPVIVAYEPTTDIPQVVQYAIKDMTITSGRVIGQKVLKVGGISLPAIPH